MEGDLTWGSEHTIQYTDNVLQNCIPETYITFIMSPQYIQLKRGGVRRMTIKVNRILSHLTNSSQCRDILPVPCAWHRAKHFTHLLI